MARYMAIIDVTAAAFKGLIQSPQDRKEATTALFSSIGGEVEHYWFGIGSNTLYIVVNAQKMTSTWKPSVCWFSVRASHSL